MKKPTYWSSQASAFWKPAERKFVAASFFSKRWKSFVIILIKASLQTNFSSGWVMCFWKERMYLKEKIIRTLFSIIQVWKNPPYVVWLLDAFCSYYFHSFYLSLALPIFYLISFLFITVLSSISCNEVFFTVKMADFYIFFLLYLIFVFLLQIIHYFVQIIEVFDLVN